MLSKTHRPRGGAVRLAGFTLVELLVVVSIIALLIGMLAPSLRSARNQAKTVVCASRLKQWGTAFGCYAAENNGVWPHCDGLDRQNYDPANPDYHPPKARPHDVADWCGWIDVLPPLIRYRPWRHHSVYHYPDARTFYQCPWGHVADSGAYNYKPEKYGYFSYAMNSCLELDRNAWRPPGGVDYPMPSFLDTSRIAATGRVILLFEQLLDPHKGFDGNMLYRSAGEHCGSYPKSFSARHPRSRSGLGGNILYCDGHVQWSKGVWRPEWDADQELPPRNDRNWYPYPVAESGTKQGAI